MKYRVYAVESASRFIGEYEAESEAEAIDKSLDDDNGGMLCHQCAEKFDISDTGVFEAEKVGP